MTLKFIRIVAILLLTFSLSSELAHVYELPQKMDLSRREYRTAQQLYEHWDYLGIAAAGSAIIALCLSVYERRNWKMFYLNSAGAIFTGLGLAVFYLFTHELDQQTDDWKSLPGNWRELREQWEYSHAATAGFYLVGFLCMICSLLVESAKPRATDAMNI